MADKEMTIFTRTYDFLTWLLPVTEGIPFLGFIVFPHRRRLKRRKGIYFQRKIKRRISKYHEGTLTLDDIHASVRGWVNHVRYGNTVGLRKSVFRQLSLRRDNDKRIQ